MGTKVYRAGFSALRTLDCVTLVGSQRRRVGDYLAGTKVVKL
ncbi:hypothetical protein AAW51_0502 [Caldimonas brevitalea]|uniref:Uncharacterized protein n=1 Tax=Caldimonas brevitalea TaxID=413882 RepID=A0A0G3BGS6_9BURK|nr:hypothetical protein AAW51_0502 [Caldimonas brevitalea]